MKRNPARERIELRAEPAWINRLAAAAANVGLSTSAYIRLAVNRMMNDPAFAPPAKAKRSKKS